MKPSRKTNLVNPFAWFRYISETRLLNRLTDPILNLRRQATGTMQNPRSCKLTSTGVSRRLWTAIHHPPVFSRWRARCTAGRGSSLRPDDVESRSIGPGILRSWPPTNSRGSTPTSPQLLRWMRSQGFSAMSAHACNWTLPPGPGWNVLVLLARQGNQGRALLHIAFGRSPDGQLLLHCGDGRSAFRCVEHLVF